MTLTEAAELQKQKEQLSKAYPQFPIQKVQNGVIGIGPLNYDKFTRWM